MKTPVELRIAYKEDTGNPFVNVEYALNEVADDNEWNSLTIMEYIEWLQNKVTETQKAADEYVRLHNYKEDYEAAIYEIGQLQYQLDNAEDEIRELNRSHEHI